MRANPRTQEYLGLAIEHIGQSRNSHYCQGRIRTTQFSVDKHHTAEGRYTAKIEICQLHCPASKPCNFFLELTALDHVNHSVSLTTAKALIAPTRLGYVTLSAQTMPKIEFFAAGEQELLVHSILERIYKD